MSDKPKLDDPFIIPSAFDSNLEIRVVNRSAQVGTKFPVYMWRIPKWMYRKERGSRKLLKYYGLRDLFLIEDMLKDAKERLKYYYKPMFDRHALLTSKIRAEERAKLAPYLWNVSDSEDEDDHSD